MAEARRFDTRFAKPIYYEEAATIRARVVRRTDTAVTIEVGAHNSADELCGTATMSLDRRLAASPPAVTDYAVAPLPEERPQVTRAHLESLTVLGTPELELDAAAAAGWVTRFGGNLGLYEGVTAPGHPGGHLDLANRALNRNMR